MVLSYMKNASFGDFRKNIAVSSVRKRANAGKTSVVFRFPVYWPSFKKIK